jgi:heat-inducible transcriptional repressor
MDEQPLGERAQQLLRVLVESYVRDGQPVGSRSLSRDSGMNLSAATIRNVMADLEMGGFVTSPHTSAGRVPTPKGYRFFVDTLLRVQPLEQAAEADIRRRLGNSDDSRSLVAAASQLLSSLTQMAGLVTLPSTQAASVTQIEFLSLSDNRVLVILVFDDREVQNRIMQLERAYSAEELRRASNLLNEQFRGRTLEQVRQALLDELSATRERLNQGMLGSINMAQQLFPAVSASGDMEYVIAGETNLMGFSELLSVDKLRRLFEAFNEKRDLLNLLDLSLKGQGVQIFIGQESGHQILDDCSIITAPYSTDSGAVGVIGVIGPTRMDYPGSIAAVRAVARYVGQILMEK